MIAKIAEGDKEDVDLAVKAARAAFDHGPWPRMPGSVRTKFRHLKPDLLCHFIFVSRYNISSIY